MIWTRINLTLNDIKENSVQGVMHYFHHKAESQFLNYKPFSEHFKTIPKSWFIDSGGKERNWEGQITVASNRNFQQFGFINRQQNMYIAYEFTGVQED